MQVNYEWEENKDKDILGSPLVYLSFVLTYTTVYISAHIYMCVVILYDHLDLLNCASILLK